MTEQQNQVIQNFLTSLDINLPIVAHFRNAMNDALIYKWPSAMLIAIMSGIEDAYKPKV